MPTKVIRKVVKAPDRPAPKIKGFEALPAWQEESRSWDFWRAVIAEFFGMAMFLFITIGCVINSTKNSDVDDYSATCRDRADASIAGCNRGTTPRVLLISLAFGFTIAVLVYIMAGISGGHLNPAVTFSLVVTRRITPFRAALYTLAQMFGGMVGAGLIRMVDERSYVVQGGGANSAVADVRVQAFGGEVFCTALLVAAVFAASDSERSAKNPHIATLAPFLIGMAVMLAHFVLIPIDGCSINPARTFATAAVSGNWDSHWVFWIGPLIGAGITGLFYDFVFSIKPKSAPKGAVLLEDEKDGSHHV